MFKGPQIAILAGVCLLSGLGCGGSSTQESTTLEPLQGPSQARWVRLPVRILFPNGGTQLTGENQALLQEAVRTLQSRPDVERVRIEGHTDSFGSDGGNRQLSFGRAEVVARYLVSQGVPHHMLETQGYGADRPATSDTQARDRAQNRRVEFSIRVRRMVYD